MSRRARIVLVVLLVSGMLSLSGSPASASSHGGLAGKADGKNLTIVARFFEKVSAPLIALRKSAATQRASASRATVRLVPACVGNSPQRGREICTRAIDDCQRRNNPGTYLAWQYLGLPLPENPKTLAWYLLGSRCVRLREPATAPPAFVLTLQDFQRLPLPPGALNIEPGTGPVLINIPTNFYVKAAPVPLTATVLGTRIDVIATPVNYHWTFGDGTTLDTTDPGNPYPHMTTTHTYHHPGPQTITLTTSYTGRYRIAGSPDPTWLPVDGTADVTSPPRTITLIETRAVLVN